MATPGGVEVDRDPPPHDNEAEAACLGAILLDPTFGGASKALRSLEEGDFYRGSHRAIFRVAKALHDEGSHPAAILVLGRLTDQHVQLEPEKVNAAVVADLVGGVASPVLVEEYAERVRKLSIARSVVDAARDISAAARDGTPQDEALDHAIGRLSRLKDDATPEREWGWLTATDLLADPEDDKSAHVWADVLAPGAVTLFAGAPKAGKSTILDALAAALERGEPWLDQDARTGPVVIVSEEGRSNLRRRMERVGARNVIVLPRGGRPKGTTWDDLVEEGERESVRVGAKLLIFDTLRGLAGFQGDDEYKPGPTQEVVRPALDVADRSRLCVALVHHRRKEQQQKSSTIDAVSGSSALTGAVDQVVGVTFTADEDDPRRTISFAGRLDSKSPIVIECVRAEGQPWRFELRGDARDVAVASVDEAILAWLAQVPGFVSKAEIQDGVRGKREVVLARVEHLARERAILRVKIDNLRYPLYADAGRDPSKAKEWSK